MRHLYTKTGTSNDAAMSGVAAAPTDAQRIEINNSTPSGDPSSGGIVLSFVPVDSTGAPLEPGSMTFDVQAYRTFRIADVNTWVGSVAGGPLVGVVPYEDVRYDDFESANNAELALQFTNIANAPVGYVGLQAYGQEVA